MAWTIVEINQMKQIVVSVIKSSQTLAEVTRLVLCLAALLFLSPFDSVYIIRIRIFVGKNSFIEPLSHGNESERNYQLSKLYFTFFGLFNVYFNPVAFPMSAFLGLFAYWNK